MTGDSELNQLRERTQKGSRVAAAVEQSESGGVTVRGGETVTFRDEFIAEFLRSIGENDSLHDDLAVALQGTLNENVDQATDRSELLSQAVRIGLQEAAPDAVEEI